MLKRIMTTVIGVGILVAVFVLDSFQWVNGPLWFNLALAAVSCMMVYEFYGALEKKEIKPIRAIGYLMALTIVPIGLIPTETLILIDFLVFPLALLVAFIVSLWTDMKYTIVDIAVTLLGPLYTIFLASFLSHIRMMEHGEWYVWFVFGGAWFTDIFAFLIGRMIGKHKMTKISPNKSWEGCIAGFVGGIVFYVIYTIVLQKIHIVALNWVWMGILGFVVSLISQIGDIAASSIKRYCQMKDFSNIMPGHGGLLDRFDSVLFVAPLVYVALAMALQA